MTLTPPFLATSPLHRVLTWVAVGLLAVGTLAVLAAPYLEGGGGAGDPRFSFHVVFTVLVALFGWMLLLQLLERIPEEERDTFRPPVGLGVVFTVLAVAMLVLDLVFRLDTAVGASFWESLVEAVAAWPPLNWGGPVVMVLGAVLVAVFGRNHHLG